MKIYVEVGKKEIMDRLGYYGDSKLKLELECEKAGLYYVECDYSGEIYISENDPDEVVEYEEYL